jgi:hypothetical protein
MNQFAREILDVTSELLLGLVPRHRSWTQSFLLLLAEGRPKESATYRWK